MTPLQVQVSFNVADLPAQHSAFTSAQDELATDVRNSPELRTAFQGIPNASAGTKGMWSDLVMTLAGPSVVAGVVRVFHLWLSRDKRRSITLTKVVADSGDEQRTTTTITGENLSEEALRQAIERLG